ncbi:amidohydrolase family protein [Halococcus sp. IIIV-5B]|uniref:amidohydrolase family protein n=1 Tax=Halococcus sp. IIIV-5B TaxID=2321230 RepID=UPI000E7143DD|nr:amidohydrolase family protein [Halococcus sp. IIIV-5B]RJT07476.1 N-isopropylammelide isopropylaminohydrolase [Halococcus sp. IIIV-5B]
MSDYIVANGTTLEGDSVDIEIADGYIEGILPAGKGNWGAYDADQRFDAEGRLVTPPLVEPHTHIFNSLSEGRPNKNQQGTLEQGWRTGELNREGRTKESVKARARRVISWFATYGITRVRTHLNVSDAEASRYTSAEAMLEIRAEFAGTVELQLVGVPSPGFARDEALYDRLETMLEMGIDVVGGWPHREDTREKGIAHVQAALELAEEYDRPVDLHIDETDDPHSRYTEVLASMANDLGIGERVTASHTTAMHSYPNAYADKLRRLLAKSGVSVITNPLSNAVLQGRYDDYPRRRGHTRVDELSEAGVTVGVGQDDISDSANPYGDGDPLKMLYHFAHFAHKNRLDDAADLWEMLTENNAEVYGLDLEEYGIDVGNEGSLVVYDSDTAFDAIRTIAPRNLVLSYGNPLATTERTASVTYNDDEEVDFSRDLP